MRYGIVSEMDKGCFFSIMDDGMRSLGIGVNQLEEMLISKGITDITNKRLSEYRNARHTPIFERAKTILSVLEIELSNEEIAESLRKNKERIRSNKENLYLESTYKDLKLTVMIKLRELIPNKGGIEAEKYLLERINELYGDERKVSAYVQGLISKDLQEGLMSHEEVKKSEQNKSFSNAQQ